MVVRRAGFARVRKAAGYTQESLAEAMEVERTTVRRWESGEMEPLAYRRPKLARVLDVTLGELDSLLSEGMASVTLDHFNESGAGLPVDWFESNLTGATLPTAGGSDPVKRRTFISVAALAAANVKFAREFAASISGGDVGPLAQVQTTYDVDRAIAAMVDVNTKNTLRRWSVDLGNPIARVNATGILAKLPDQSESREVVAILRNDDEVRQLYLTAVTTRVCALDWDHAATLVQGPAVFPFARIAAERFAREVVNPIDVGARWCSAKMLQDLSPAIGR